ncbi:MAG: DUF2680 domain-containing protein [Bacillota bacterium]
MNKKWIAAIVLVALATLIAVPVFAAETPDNKSWFDSRFAAKRAYVDQAVKDGRMTQEQGEAWKKHLDQMYSFHQQNGFICPMGGPGGKRGQGMGSGPGGGMGRGGGMMGGWGFNQSPAPAPAQ